MANNLKQKTQNIKTSSSGAAKSMAELMANAGSSLQILQRGQAVTGTIKKLTPGEILMDIGGKGDALVIEFDRQNLENLLSMLKVGDRVTATVISPESEEGFPVVSLRRMLDDAIFKNFDALIAADKSFEVNIIEATRGGYFGQTKEGIRGFLPASQIFDPSNTSGQASTDLSGKTIQVKIIEVDRAKKKIIFSQKALLYLTNLEEIKKLFKAGQSIEAEVINVTPYGLFVLLEKDGQKAEGFIHISEISYNRVEDLASKFKVGEKLTAQVIEIDTANKRVNLSIKRTKKDTFSEIESKYKIEQKVRGKVAEIKNRGITLRLAQGKPFDQPQGKPDVGEVINGFIPADKVPSGITYEVGQEVDAEVVEFDKRRRVIVLSPILKAVPIGYR